MTRKSREERKSRPTAKKRDFVNDGMHILKSLGGVNLMNLPITRAMVPPGMTFRSWHTNLPEKVSQSGGANIIMGENPMLSSWINIKELPGLTPETLIPLGLLILTYNMYARNVPIPKRRSEKNKQKGGAGITSILEHPIVSELLQLSNIPESAIKPALLVPFALLMGRDVFKAFLHKRDKETKSKD